MTSFYRGFPGVLAAAVLAVGLPAMAQPASIRQGFDAAWARQPEQRAAALRRDAAAAGVLATRRWTPEPPSLDISARTDRFTRNDGVRELDAAIAVPMWLPGERTRAHAAATAEAGAVDARLLAAQWRTAGDVRDAFWAVQRARVESALADQRLAGARALAADVERRLQAGDLSRADNHQAQAAVAAAEAVQAEAAASESRATQRWLALTGLPATDDVSPEPAPDGAANAAHPAVLEWTAKAETARRQRALAGAQTRANPELTIGAVRERDGRGERYGQSLLIGLRIPLGTASASQTRQATAAADALEAEAQLALVSERVQSDITAARAQLDAARAANAATERRAALARESRGFFDKSFRLGETDLPTRVRSELEAAEAERQAARSRIDLDAAVSQLRQALGLLPE